MSEAITAVTDQTFEAAVLQSQIPVLVDYWAPWCGPCKVITPMLEESTEDFAGQVSIAKVNIDENPGAPSRYNVRSIPTLMLFKGGKPVATQVGAVSRAKLADFIRSNLQ